MTLDLLPTPVVRLALGDAVAPTRACVSVHEQEAAWLKPLDVVVAGGVAVKVHVDRGPQAHGGHDGTETIAVDVRSDALTGQVLVDDRLFERSVGIEYRVCEVDPYVNSWAANRCRASRVPK